MVNVDIQNVLVIDSFEPDKIIEMTLNKTIISSFSKSDLDNVQWVNNALQSNNRYNKHD